MRKFTVWNLEKYGKDDKIFMVRRSVFWYY